MTVKPRRKFKRPVISRLTLAWTSAAAFTLLAVGVALYPTLSGRGVNRISLPVENVEMIARAPAPASEPIETGGLRLSAPGLREETAPPQLGESLDSVVDMLDYPEEFDPAVDPSLALDEEPFTAEDVVITIAGSEKRVTQVTAASLTRSDRAIPVADPDPALLRKTAFGSIPKPGADGRKAMHVYRNSFSGGDGRPQVALIVGGLGLNKSITERAIDELPAEISLAFAPYAKDLEFWTTKARRAGHEVLIELPMESYGGDPSALGAAGLLTSRSPAENLQRLDWLMSRFGGYFAATNYLGGKFAANDEAMTPILSRLREAGVGYIDDTGAARSVAPRARATVASVDLIIPPAPDNSARRSVKSALASLERSAHADGAALGKTYAYAATIEEIAEWAKTLDKKGLMLSPASSRLPTRYASR